MPHVLVLIYSTLFGRQPGTNSNSQYGNESVNLWASEPWLFLFGFGRLTMLGPSARRLVNN